MEASVGDYLVHKSSGTCQVVALEERNFKGQPVMFAKTEVVVPILPPDEIQGTMANGRQVHIYPLADEYTASHVRSPHGLREFKPFVAELLKGVGVPPVRKKFTLDTVFSLNVFDWSRTAEELSYLYTYLYHAKLSNHVFFLSDHKVYDTGLRHIANEVALSNKRFTQDDVLRILEMALFVGHHCGGCEECKGQEHDDVAKAALPVCNAWIDEALKGKKIVLPSVTSNLPIFLLESAKE